MMLQKDFVFNGCFVQQPSFFSPPGGSRALGTMSCSLLFLVSAVLTWVRREKINTVHQSMQCSFSWVLQHHILIIFLKIMATIDWIRFLYINSFSSAEVHTDPL